MAKTYCEEFTFTKVNYKDEKGSRRTKRSGDLTALEVEVDSGSVDVCEIQIVPPFSRGDTITYSLHAHYEFRRKKETLAELAKRRILNDPEYIKNWFTQDASRFNRDGTMGWALALNLSKKRNENVTLRKGDLGELVDRLVEDYFITSKKEEK